MSKLKYSEYVRMIADKITPEHIYICIEIEYHPLSRGYPEYAEKLSNTIKNKLAKLQKHNDDTTPTTLIRAWMKSGMKVDEVTFRKQWLESIARIHEKKGN